MKINRRKSYFLILCALLICAFGATAGIADGVIDMTGANTSTYYDISNSADVVITGRYVMAPEDVGSLREAPLVYGDVYNGTVTLDGVHIWENAFDSKSNYGLFRFADTSAGVSTVTLLLSGDNTITSALMTPLFIEKAYRFSGNKDNELIISGTGRLTVTGGPAHETRRVAAIGARGQDGSTFISGKISIQGGYIVATGWNAPAIGTYEPFSGSPSPARIKISGGVVEAKTNDTEMYAIGIRYGSQWYDTIITGGSISADSISKPVNENGTPLTSFDVDFGTANTGNTYTFTVNETPALSDNALAVNDNAYAYDYTFTVPDDGIAWLWLPETNQGDIPLVPRISIDAEGSAEAIELSVAESSGTPDSYRWFKAESEAGPFAEITGATGASYTDNAVTTGDTYWYKATPVYTSEYFNDFYSNTISVIAAQKSPRVTPKLAILSWYGEVSLAVEMGDVAASEYKWFRGTSEDGPFEEVATTAVPNHVDKGAAMGTTYWYYVEADGVMSDIKSITPQKDCPSSSNCNAGFGVLALFALLAPAGVILRKRG